MRIRIRMALLVVAAGSLAGCAQAGAAITRLAVGEPGPDAYTLVSGTDDPKVTRRVEAGGERAGDQPGLYGGTRRAAGCDKDKLVRYLKDNPDKAAAWAGVHRITAAAIPAFVGRLTPVVLRVDTFVTNHGYRSGEATSMPAVLQAGVGVLVDARGVPVVKCNCGNPLTAPDKEINTADSRYEGTKWPQFSAEKVTVVEPPAQEMTSLMLVDPVLGMIFPRPAGTEGESDGVPAPVPPGAMADPAAPTPAPGGSEPVRPGPDRPAGDPTAADPTTADPTGRRWPTTESSGTELTGGVERPVVTVEPPRPSPEPGEPAPAPEPVPERTVAEPVDPFTPT
ncbi:MAG: DUF6777 domain-containing protein [Streptosporangiaceae bacterium]